MKILFDHQIFSYHDWIGGVVRYFYEIINRMPIKDWDISIKYSNNELLEKLADKKGIKYSHFMPGLRFSKKGRLMLELGKFHSEQIIKREDFDILHLTHYESYCLNSTKKPIVLTYHDKLFSSFAYNVRTIKEQKKCFERAAAVICISENTKKDFLENFDYPEERIKVIYHGVNTLPEIDGPNPFDFKYILFVGGRCGYKNFENLALAFVEIKRDFPELKLMCTGKEFSKEETENLRRLGILDSVKAEYVDDYKLAQLYAYAECFVFPSKYEGFGMPLLEAMSMNCPVCCSDAHCFPEIVQDAASMFNPESPESIKIAIERILNDNNYREDLLEKQHKRLLFFSWEKSYKAHMDLYKSLMEKK